MSDFTITKNERAGIEKAARWHWEKFETLKALSEERRLRGVPYAGLALEMEYHLHSAGALNWMLHSKSSVPGRQISHVEPDSLCLDASEAAQYLNGPKSK